MCVSTHCTSYGVHVKISVPSARAVNKHIFVRKCFFYVHYKIFNHLVILIQPACSRQYTELLTAEPLTVASCRLKTHLGAREASLHLTHVPPPCPCCVDKRASAPRTDLTPAAEGCGKKHARHKGHVIRYSAPVSRRRLPSFDPPPTPGLGGGEGGGGERLVTRPVAAACRFKAR